MHTALTLFVSSCILIQGAIAAPLHNIPGFANAVAQTTYKDRSCREQAGSCDIQPQYKAAPQEMRYSYVQPQVMPMYQQSEEQPADEESTPDEGQMEQAPAEDGRSQFEDQTQEAPSYSTGPASWNVDLSRLQPKQALLDEVKGHSAQGSQVLSDSNQFDQAQLVDQTVYQPAQPPQPPIIIPQWPIHRPTRAYKKYKKFAHRSFKIKYFSGNRR
ncbi:hypothetical protein K7432_009545 [Basidiobolus ranarum]|uniref:Uncharacterized protein n=1 Tax=Basidiobolus ranarum TaxID=34480 RepID=A0ABR2VWX7_9FUNG